MITKQSQYSCPFFIDEEGGDQRGEVTIHVQWDSSPILCGSKGLPLSARLSLLHRSPEFLIRQDLLSPPLLMMKSDFAAAEPEEARPYHALLVSLLDRVPCNGCISIILWWCP